VEEKIRDTFKLLLLIGLSGAAAGVILLAVEAVGQLGG
jgi:hypothetical protein